MSNCVCVRASDAIGRDHELATLERRAYLVRIGKTDDGIRRHDPHGLDGPRVNRVEQIDGFEPSLARDRRAAPEILYRCSMRSVAELHVRREHVSETADLATPHRVRLSGDGERPHAG